MKKYLTLAATMVAATLTGSAADYTLGGLSYDVISEITGTVRVVASASATGDVNIPASVTLGGKQYTVTEIEKQCFTDSKMTSVVIPESILTIGDGAFSNCKRLQYIAYNASECTIAGVKENSAFSGCTAVTQIKIGDDVSIIPPYLFQGLSALRSITIPRNIAAIGERAFADCIAVSEIYFDAEHCGQVSYPFAGCINPFNMIISDNVEEVPAYLCEDSQIKSLTVGKNVKTIKKYAFGYSRNALETVIYNAIDATCYQPFYNGGSNLKKLVLGSEVRKIPDSFAYSCSKLTNVAWNDKLEEIGESAFRDCSFVSFTAPESLKIIGKNAFPSTLETIKLNEGLEILSGFGSSKITEVTIPSTVRVIGDYAFSDCYKLVTVEGLESDVIDRIGEHAFDRTSLKAERIRFGKNLKSIGNYAFNEVKQIHNVILNEGLESVGNYAFKNDIEAFSGIDFILPSSLRTIGSFAFSNSGITGKLVIPEGITSLNQGSFSLNTAVTELEYNAIDCNLDISWLYYESDGPFGGISVKTIKFGDKVETIGKYLFYKMTQLESIVFPPSLKCIKEYAFDDCTNLNHIEFNEGLKRIECSFYGTKLAEIEIPSTVSYINQSFAGINEPASSRFILLKAIFNAKLCAFGHEWYDFARGLQKLVIGESVEWLIGNFFNEELKWVKWDATEISQYYYNSSNSSYNKATCPVILGENVRNFIGYKFQTVISNAPLPPTLIKANAGAVAYVPDIYEYGANPEWAKYVLRQSVTWKGTMEGQNLTYTTNFPYELTFKHFLDSDGNIIEGEPMETGHYKAIFTYTIEDDEFELISPLEIDTNTANTMHIPFVRTHTGRRVVIPIEMVNEEPITSFQLDLYLPECLKLVTDEYGDYAIDMTDRKSNTHTLTTTDLDGGIRIAALSMRNQTFSGNDGALLELTLDVAEDAPVGESVITLRNIRMVEPSAAAMEFFTTHSDSKVSIGKFIEGDTNDDGQVTVADVVNTVNKALGIEPETFVFDAGDLVADGKITISDVVAVMNIAMNEGRNAPARRTQSIPTDLIPTAEVESFADGYGLSVGEVHIDQKEPGEMTVAMSNEENVTAFQFDLYLPEGISVPEDEWGDPAITLSRRASRSHILVTRYQPDGALRVASYSSKNDPFRENTGDLLTIELQAAEDLPAGNYSIGFKFIELTNPDATPHYIPDFEVVATVGTTGTVTLQVDPKALRVWGEEGEIVISASETTPVTVCGIDGKVVTSQSAEEGITRIPVAPGLYIVNGIKLAVK